MDRKHCGKWEKEKLLVTSNFSFSHSCFPGVSKGVTVWEWVKLNQTPIIARSRMHTFKSTVFQLAYEDSIDQD